jgi:hypothetical protein
MMKRRILKVDKNKHLVWSMDPKESNETVVDLIEETSTITVPCQEQQRKSSEI